MYVYKLNDIKLITRFAINNKYCSFYRDKYQKAGFKYKYINNYNEFSKLQLLTKEEIIAVPPLERLFMPEEKVGCWFRTSGTTSGKPLLIPASYHIGEHLELLESLLIKNNVKKLMVLTPPGFLTMKLFDAPKSLKINSHSVLIVGDIRDMDLTSKLITELKIDGLQTTPSALYYLIPYLKDACDLSKIKFIRLLGEYTSEVRYDFFKSYFKGAYFDFDYGSNEARGNVGIRCDYLNMNYAPRYYHPKKDFMYEIIDTESNVIPDGGVGELVLTTLFKTPFPLLRYKTGDAFKITKVACKCGRDTIIESFGRMGYDSVRIGGITLHRHLFEELMAELMGRNFDVDYEVHIFEVIYENRLVPKLNIKIATSNKINTKVLAKKIESKLQVGSRTYISSLVEQGIFAPISIEKVDSFERSYKKIKFISHLK